MPATGEREVQALRLMRSCGAKLVADQQDGHRGAERHALRVPLRPQVFSDDGALHLSLRRGQGRLWRSPSRQPNYRAPSATIRPTRRRKAARRRLRLTMRREALPAWARWPLWSPGCRGAYCPLAHRSSA